MDFGKVKSGLPGAAASVFSNVVAGLITTPILIFLVWLAAQSSPLLSFLFGKVWAFLTYPVALPLGFLLLVVVSGLANRLISAGLNRVAPGASRKKAGLIRAALLIGLPVAAFLVYSWLHRPPPYRPKPPEKLTSEGNVERAAVSPDGRHFVFGVNHHDGRHSLRLGQVATRSSVQILEPEKFRYEGLTFSPDGLYVYFVGYEKNRLTPNLYQVTSLGGQPKKILSDLPRFFSFALSLDGRQLAFVENIPEKNESALVVADAFRTDEKRRVATRTEPEQFVGVPAWAPDGKRIVCAVGSTREDEVKLVRVSVDGGAEEGTPLSSWKFVGQISWLSDNNGLVLSASKISGPYQIWRIPYAGGEPEQITNDLNNYDSMSLTADSSSLLTVQDDLTASVWVLPPGLKTVSTPSVGVGRHNDYWGFGWTRDGRILYESTAGGNQDIWVMSPDGGNRKQLTASAGDNFDPCMTHDGRHIVFTAKRGEFFNIWRMNSDGGAPVQLTRGVSDFTPFCAPKREDGDWVVYTSAFGGKFTLWKVRVGGGPPVPLTERPSQWPAVSPDGKQVACFYEDEQTKELVLAVIPFEGGQPVKKFEIEPTVNTWAEIRWIRGGRELTYIDDRGGVSNIWSQPVEGGKPRQLTHFPDGRIFRYAWSDDDALVLSHGSVTRDVVMIKLPPS